MAQLEIGTIVDRRYLLKREVARGGAGAVFEAEHVFTKRAVAIKLLLPEHANDTEARERLLREAHALTLARHPGVVLALDAGETPEHAPYLVLELLEGRTLAGILAVKRVLDPADVISLGVQLCESLAVAHQRGILHRDLKPSNVFVARDDAGREVTKLFDFGVARLDVKDRRKLTQDSSVPGTPEYMPLEQLLASPNVDARCDIYALGVTLYECLAGVVPFEGNFGEVLLKVSTEPIPPLRPRTKGAPAELCEAIEKALAREPEQRFADARAFGQALAKLAAKSGQTTSLLGIRLAKPPPLPVATPPASASLVAAAPVAARAVASPPAGPPPLPATRRRFARAPYVTPVRIVRDGEPALDGRSEDLSVGGLLVLTGQACKHEEKVAVRFALPLTGKVVEVRATARWIQVGRRTGAVGLEFSALPPEAHEMIDKYVALMGGV